MTSICTRTDVEDLLLADLSANADAIGRLIDRAAGQIEAALPGLDLSLTPVHGATATIEGDGDDYVLLPHYPVTAVSAVTIGGAPLPSDGWRFDVLGRLWRVVAGVTNPQDSEGTGALWPDRGVIIVATFDYGFSASTLPAVFTNVAAELVAARVTNPAAVAQESLGDRSVSFAGGRDGSVGLRLGAGHLAQLRNWRRNTFATRVRS